MIVSIVNSTDIFWLPVYSLNDKMHRSSGFPALLLAQFLIYFLTAYVLIRTCSIFLSIRVFHQNMNILMAWFLCQWFEAILAKLVIIPYQLGLIVIDIDEPERTFYAWWTDNVNDMIQVNSILDFLPLYLACLFLWHYIYSVIFCIVMMGFERICATFYIQDYESVPRRHIPILLIVLTNLITIPYAYQVLNNGIPFMAAYIQCFLNASICFFGYFGLWRWNVMLRDRMARGSDNDKYCLPRKFQVEENIRSLILAKKVVYTTVIYLSLSLIVLFLLVFGVFEGYEPLFVHILDNFIFGAAPVLSIALLFCSPAWKEAFISQLPFIRNYRNPQVVHLNVKWSDAKVSETDVYFTQLKNAWV